MWKTIWIVTKSYKWSNHSIAFNNYNEAIARASYLINNLNESVISHFKNEKVEIWKLQSTIIKITKQQLFVN